MRVTSGGRYLPLVDGLRFLAIMPVIVQHTSERLIRHTPVEFSTPIEQDQLAFLASRGTIGVFIFFALSGFMLSLPFAKYHLEGGKEVSIKQYFLRRFTRIEPPYLVWMTVFGLVLILQGAWAAGDMLPHWLASCFYIHNFVYGEYSVINPVAWSLEIEIQFYLLAPWIVGMFFSIKDARARQLALIASTFGFIALQHGMGWQYFPYKPTLLGQLQHFLTGIWLADCYLSHWRKKESRHLAWDFAFIPALLLMAYTWTEEFGKSLLFAVAMAAVFTAAFRGRFFHNILQFRWIAVIGGMCYTIYLTHLPLLELQMKFTNQLTIGKHYLPNLLLQLTIALPIIFTISAVFYLLLEKPFMQLKAPYFKGLVQTYTAMLPPFLRLQPLKKALVRVGASFSFLFFLFLPKNLVAQDEFNFRLPPLDTLIKKAIEKSPSLRSQDVWIETKKEEWKVEKKSWADLVTVGGTALFGTNTVLDYQQTTVNSEYISVDRRSAIYNAGLTLRFSLGDVLTRGDKAHIKRLDYEKAQADRQVIEWQIREEVLVRYDRFEASYRMLDIEAQNVEAIRMALEVAKKYFEEGSLEVSEYSTTLSRFATAQKQFEQAKLSAKHDYRMLLEIAGL